MPDEITPPTTEAPEATTEQATTEPEQLPDLYPTETPAEAAGEPEATAGAETPATTEEAATEAPAAPRSAEDIARRDRELLEAQATVQAQLGQLQEYQQLRQQAAEGDQLAAARALGIDPMALAEAVLGGGQEAEQAPPDPALQTLTEQVRSLSEQLSAQQAEGQRNTEMGKISSVVAASAETLPMLNTLAAENPAILQDVYAAAADYHQRTGQIPDYGQMAADVEKQYAANVFNSLKALSTLPSVQEQLKTLLTPADKPTSPANNPPTQAVETGTGGTTLTQDMAGEPLTETQAMDEDALEAEAMKILAGGPKE